MQDLIVETAYGKIRGVQEDCIVFKGIPYAKPPVGDLRFRAPKRPDAWSGVYEADHWPNRCVQGEGSMEFFEKEFYSDPEYKTPISEDGLYLNIWTPSLGADKKMPVLFYIHGGGFGSGCGHELEFRTDAYAKKDVVLVTINYRLGILGYLAHPWLTAEDETAVGNYAVLDQMAALKWVKENIAAFGGDPENITISGQSAGGMSVVSLVASPMAAGLFQKAIIQSATGYPSFVANVETLADAEAMGERTLGYAGITSIEELRSASTDVLMKAQEQLIGESFASGKGLPYAPVINGHVLTEGVTEAIEAGHLNRVPTMIGCTKDDITVTPEELAVDDSRIHRSDIAYSLQCEKMQQNPAYVYWFKRNLPGDEWGAFHSSELWYMFGTYKNCWRPFTEGDAALSEEMVTCWSNFAKFGNPNGEADGDWKLCTAENQMVKIFDVPED